MTPNPCPFCKEAPAIHRSQRNGPKSFIVECVSLKCAMRVVKTHSCGDEESAINVWNAE